EADAQSEAADTDETGAETEALGRIVLRVDHHPADRGNCGGRVHVVAGTAGSAYASRHAAGETSGVYAAENDAPSAGDGDVGVCRCRITGCRHSERSSAATTAD